MSYLSASKIWINNKSYLGNTDGLFFALNKIFLVEPSLLLTTEENIGLQFLANGLSLCCSVKSVALFMKSTWKATKTTDSTQISHFDLVFHRVQRECQLGRSYILMVFGGAHACLVVYKCVYGACMYTYVWSFVLYNFIMDFIKCNTILLKPKWFHFMGFQTTSWNPTGFYRVTRFHKIHRSLQDYLKSRSISWNLSGFH